MGTKVSSFDLVSPTYIGEKRIDIQLSKDTAVDALKPITIEFNYGRVGQDGVQIPLDLVVQPGFGGGGEGNGYLEKVFFRDPPSQFTFTVPTAGQFLIVLKERFHNRFWGSLLINVEGEYFSRLGNSLRNQ